MVLGNEMHANIASAALNSVSNNGGTTSITSGRWAAVATTTPATPGTSAYVNSNVTAAGVSGNNGNYFSVVNTGTLTLLDLNIRLTTTSTKSNSYVVNIHGCSTTWTEATGACPSGTITLLYTLSVPTSGTLAQKTSTGSMAIPLALSGAKRLRIQFTGTGSPTIGATIDTLISRSNARAATDTNS